MQRYDFDTDEACTYIRFRAMDDGEYVKHDEAMLAVVELAYSMNEIFNMKKELKRTYNLISYHAARGNHAEDCAELLRIAMGVTKDAGRHTLAFRIGHLLDQMMMTGIK